MNYSAYEIFFVLAPVLLQKKDSNKYSYMQTSKMLNLLNILSISYIRDREMKERKKKEK